MSGYYYSREAGDEGQILTGEGVAPGVGLDTLLDRERPPLRAALAIGSAIADVLCIAVEDRLIHGDIRPAHVKIDARGTVSIEGYGVARRTTKAPEGKPDSHAVDVYGLGVILHSILSPEPLGNLPRDPDGHDDEVVSRVLSMDFRQVQGKRWLEDVRKFLCQILAWAPADRPEALDAANVLASVAGQCPGETLEAWALRATAPTSRNAPAAAPAPRRPVAEEEDLGGPVALSGPLAKGGARQAPAAKGESTAFWSREKIAAMLAEDDDDDEPAPPPVRRQAVAPPAAPPRAPAPPPRSAASLPPAPRAEPPPRAPEPPPRAPAPRAAPVEPPARPAPVAEARPAASPFAPAASGPLRIEASSPVFDDEPPKKKTSPMVIAGVVGVILVLLCGVLTLGGGGMYWFMGGNGAADAARVEAEKASKVAEEAAEKARIAAEAAAADAAEAGTDAPPGTAAGTPGATDGTKAGTAAPSTAPSQKSPATTKASGTASAPKTTAASTRTTTPKTTAPAATKAAAPAAAAAPPAGASFSVKFTTPGREAKLQCGDGQTADFAGATTMTFQDTTTCLVRIDSGKGAVQVSRSASISCTEDAGKVSCSGG